MQQINYSLIVPGESHSSILGCTHTDHAGASPFPLPLLGPAYRTTRMHYDTCGKMQNNMYYVGCLVRFYCGNVSSGSGCIM